MTRHFPGQGGSRWMELHRLLRHHPATARMLPHDLDMLCEVESVLYLYERLVPDPSKRLVREAWTLISGYAVEGLNDTPEKMRMCLLGRNRLRFIKHASAWHWWLEWYEALPEAVRLYKREPGLTGFQARIYEVPVRSERLETYEALFTADEPSAGNSSQRSPATAGKYHFTVDTVTYEVEISEAMAAFAGIPTPKRDIPVRMHRESLPVNMDILLKTAQELDALEASIDMAKRGNWHERLSMLHFTLFNGQEIQTEQKHLTIDGLFHLVGALGAGKSTLIWVLTYYLARHEEKHVTVMLHTVVEAIQMAAWLRRLGVAAAPALGRERDKHEQKYGLANAQRLSVKRLFQAQPMDEPELRWMPAPCALSGAVKSIPAGDEPCRNLLDENGKAHVCPMLPVCPVHQLARDLVESRVWIVNPMSMLYSFAPEGTGDERIRLLDAIYRLSDVLIVDEADRVQVEWDKRFAPTRVLAGSEQAFLDRLHRQIAPASVGIIGRQRSTQAAFQALVKNDNQAHTLSSAIFRLLGKVPKLVKWMNRLQMNNYRLFKRLTRELVKTLPEAMSADERIGFQQKLENEFRMYWGKPLSQRLNVLNTWVKNLVGGDVREKVLESELKTWLSNYMGWSGNLTRRQKTLFRRLQFCVTFAAMMARTNDIYDQLPWIQDELVWDSVEGRELPDEVAGLVPDPPPGNLLGVSLIHSKPGENLGVFHSIRYLGVGRWLLLNFARLYEDSTGLTGPHVLLTSATSWFPGAAQFHLSVAPHALLSSDVSTGKIDIQFRPIRNERGYWMKVSGAKNRREHNLRQIVRRLAAGSRRSPSDFQKELDFWKNQDTARRLLLVVNSYEQAEWVLDEFRQLPEWAGRVRRLLRDDAETEDVDILRAREVERFGVHDADILIAPLMSIQRGFNILDEDEGALLGTAYFLVRPYPPPEDLSPQILSMNAWLLTQLEDNHRLLKSPGKAGIEAINDLRQRAVREWFKRLNTGRISAMKDTAYQEFIRDNFVNIWQTTGRLLRGGRDARVLFVDAAFSPGEGKRQMLLDWHDTLQALMTLPSESERYLATALYGAASDAFQRALEQQRIF